jgi:hypothetical protein
MIIGLIEALNCKRKKVMVEVKPPQKKQKREYECPICKGVFFTSWITHCGHKFCPKCIEIHLNSTQNCPICRTDLAGTLLGPSKSCRTFDDRYVRVTNGVKCPYQGLEVVVKDRQGNWHDGQVKLVIENGDNFPLLLVHYGVDLIETIPQDSMRLKLRKTDSKDEIKELQN